MIETGQDLPYDHKHRKRRPDPVSISKFADRGDKTDVA